MLSKPSPQSETWEKLRAHKNTLAQVHIKDLFEQDPQRFSRFHEKIDGLLFDYSKHKITPETLQLLTHLAREARVEEWRDRLFSGEKINTSEKRAVLHPALRGSVDNDLVCNGENVSAFVKTTKAKMKDICARIHGEQTFDTIVNIGIGGSDLGPRMVCRALAPFAQKNMSVHFVANIDGADITNVLKHCDPARTLFIIASKSFATLETLTNAKTAQHWITRHLGQDAIAGHFIAVSNNAAAAQDFGIDEDNILPLRDWIGGRYSLWSAIGLPIALYLGYEHFESLLKGAHAMDRHFLETQLDKNIPVLMALIGAWYRNIWDYPALAVLPYAENLAHFTPFIQQLDMESNGKSVDRTGRAVSYKTGPVIFGQPGTNGQHAFYQLLHQGTEIIPCDFIAFVKTEHDLEDQHTGLLANVLAQAQALMLGRDHEDPRRAFTGNRPSSMLILDRLDPYHLGMLIALYEHKIFVQGILWNINSFDQWGVELGKIMARTLTSTLEHGEIPGTFDHSTKSLLKYLRQVKNS